MRVSCIVSLRNALAMTARMLCLIFLDILTPLSLAVDAPRSDKWHHFLAFSALTISFISVWAD
jgi:hypothetical protein